MNRTIRKNNYGALFGMQLALENFSNRLITFQVHKYTAEHNFCSSTIPLSAVENQLDLLLSDSDNPYRRIST